MLDKVSSLIPSGEQVGEAVTTVSWVVCAANALNKGKRTLILFAALLVVWYMTSGWEDLDDIIGVVESIEDSHVEDDVLVIKSQADRHVSVAVPLPDTAKTTCEHTEHKRPDGSVEHRTSCSCSGPDVTYINEEGKEKQLSCGVRSGSCPTDNGYVVTLRDGRQNCVFGSTPQVKCFINDSAEACNHEVRCPEVGDPTPMARALSDGKLACLVGNWNRARITVRYTPPVSGWFASYASERTQVLEIPMSQAASERYTVGQSIPVFYSRQKRHIFQHDSNPATLAGYVVRILFALTVGSAADTASFLILPLCGLRILDRNSGFVKKKTGLNLLG